MQGHVGFYSPYYVYSIVVFIIGVQIYFFIPETEGKTLEEIQEELLSDSKTKYKMRRPSIRNQNSLLTPLSLKGDKESSEIKV